MPMLMKAAATTRSTGDPRILSIGLDILGAPWRLARVLAGSASASAC